MDFEEIDFEEIRPLCSIKPIEEYKMYINQFLNLLINFAKEKN